MMQSCLQSCARRLATLLLTLLPAWAAAAPCQSGNLADYLALGSGGCSLGSATAGNFSLASGQTGFDPLPAGAILVTPLADLPSPGFIFSFNITATPASLESLFHFTLQGLPAAAQALSLQGSAQSGDGSVSVVEDLCIGAPFNTSGPFDCTANGGTPFSLIAVNTPADVLPDDARDFPVASFFDVFVDLTLDGPGAGSGTASLDSLSLRFSAVPEPALPGLLAASLATLAIIRRRPPHQLPGQA